MNGVSGRRRSLCFLMVASGVFLTTLDSSMINVALPSIMEGLDERMDRIDMVVIAYLAVISVSLVFWGRLGDTVGKGKVYVAGISIFGCGALLCGLSTDLYQLIGARSIQGCGAAMMMATGPALIKLVFPGERLGRMLGLIGIATSCGLTCGPAAGGYLLSLSGSWHVVFVVHLPLCLLLASLGFFVVLPELKTLEKPHSFPFDWAGGLLWMIFVVSYIAFYKVVGTNLKAGMVLFASCGLVGIFFGVVESRARKPILPIHLVSERFFWTAVAAATLAFTSLFIVIILLPFYLGTILGQTPGQTGMTMMALPISLVLFSPLSGWIYDKKGRAYLLSSGGLLVGALGVLLMIFFHQETSPYLVAFGLGIVGCGLSIFLTPNSASVLSRVQKRYSGISSGILATARNFGMMSGAAISGAGFALVYQALGSEHGYGATSVQPEVFMRSMQLVFVAALILLVVGSVISLLRGSSS